jgi:peptidoglycan hydrolase-like protein with peptidoglycan-binding domain
MVGLDELFRKHHVLKMHPEYARRLRVWLEAQGGRVGIGGSWRASQPAKPGFAPEGKSFHQSQTFQGGRTAFAAVDLVHVNPGGKHRSPKWSEVPVQGTPDARKWGVHCNVAKEPWHMQPVELDGFAGWIKNGRKELVLNYPIPGSELIVVEPEPSVAPGPAAVFAYPGLPIVRGSTNTVAVKLVQAVVGAKPDGDFGPATERRVKAWQKERSLRADGVVGPVTWKAMFG